MIRPHEATTAERLKIAKAREIASSILGVCEGHDQQTAVSAIAQALAFSVACYAKDPKAALEEIHTELVSVAAEYRAAAIAEGIIDA